jgi:EAL domain-containing protein (putative c-di-GMP-specific phosphodiesterase class I)
LSISGHLKFKLIASGINTQEQYQALIDAGCEFGQGKFLHKAAKTSLTQMKSLS